MLDYAPAIGVFGPVEIGPWMDGMTQKFGVPVYVENDTNAQCMGEHELAVRGTLCMFRRERAWVRGHAGRPPATGRNEQMRRDRLQCVFEDYKRTARAATLPGEQRIGYHVLERSSPWTVFPPQPDPARASGADGGPGDGLALCIANLTHVLDCSTVVLGGEVAELLGDALLDAAERQAGGAVPSRRCGCAVRPARTTASSAWRPISRAWKWMRFWRRNRLWHI
ncbi:MAG: hypothetical protein ACLR7U_06005 [Ruthenibacterium lactatiformans]